ncbi:hypothetical protein, partial [Klebsiella pneumoniae]|uniref:hypothetical protein n=1 Tax=Klebsiella pneumoniae TaxID=573 RepID=UPI001D0F3150
LMMSLWDALRMNMMISYQELVRTFLSVAILLPWNHPENQILNYYNPVNRVYWYVTIGALSGIPEASRYF